MRAADLRDGFTKDFTDEELADEVERFIKQHPDDSVAETEILTFAHWRDRIVLDRALLTLYYDGRCELNFDENDEPVVRRTELVIG